MDYLMDMSLGSARLLGEDAWDQYGVLGLLW